MLAPSWIALFKIIPANLHDTLALITTTGIEVMIQRLLRVEPDYLILRGRMSGTMDSGRVMIMPYDQISNIAFNKRMLEAEVDEVFGKSGGYVPPALANGKERPAEVEEASADAGAAQEKVEATAEIVVDVPLASPPAEPAAPSPAPPAPVKPETSKSMLLARLRARLAGKAK